MSEAMPGTVETSNNVGRIVAEEDHLFVSTHTRSFVDDDMAALSKTIAATFAEAGAVSEVVMSAPAWQEDQQSPFLQRVSDTFQDVLGGGLLRAALSRHPDRQHRSAHRGAALHQRARGALDHPRHLEGADRVAGTVGVRNDNRKKYNKTIVYEP